MSGVADDDVFRLGPGARQRVRAADRAHHVIAPLDDRRRQMADPADPRQEIPLGREQMRAEVMRFDPRQSKGEPVFAKGGDGFRVG